MAATSRSVVVRAHPIECTVTVIAVTVIDVLHALVENGNMVVVIEHNLEVIKTADWILDLGPEGGDKGREVVAEGTPEDVAKEARSYTGAYLKPLLEGVRGEVTPVGKKKGKAAAKEREAAE